MTFFLLPVRPSIPAQSFGVVLDGKRYRVSLDWIGRIDRWSIDLALENGAAIFSGRVLTTGSDLLRQFQASGPLAGSLFLVDRKNLGREASLDSLGRSDGHSLVYMTPGEVVSASAPEGSGLSAPPIPTD